MDENLQNMFLTHVKYINPLTILKDDDIFIQACNEKYVWFAVNDTKASTLKGQHFISALS